MRNSIPYSSLLAREWWVAMIAVAIGGGLIVVMGAVVLRMEYPYWLK
jgi:hypothetical protein